MKNAIKLSDETKDRELRGCPCCVNDGKSKKGNVLYFDKDRCLIHRFRNENDTDAFAKLMTKYRDKVWRLARGITRSNEDAEDVMQEVFMTVFKKLDTFEGRSTFSSWLYRIAANASYMKLRSKKPVNFYDPKDIEFFMEKRGDHHNHSEGRHDPERLAGSKITIEIIKDAIESLPEKYREVLVLRDVEEFTNKEVADMLGSNISAIKSRLHRARIILRKKLLQLYESEIKKSDRPFIANRDRVERFHHGEKLSPGDEDESMLLSSN